MMDGRKSFPHDMFMRSHPKVKLLQALLNDVPAMEVYGRLNALLELMYITGNAVPVETDAQLSVIAGELCCDVPGACRFLDACAEAGWVDTESYSRGVLSSHNVQEQLDYYESKVEAARNAGKKSGDARRKRSAERAKS